MRTLNLRLRKLLITVTYLVRRSWTVCHPVLARWERALGRKCLAIKVTAHKSETEITIERADRANDWMHSMRHVCILAPDALFRYPIHDCYYVMFQLTVTSGEE